MRGSLSFRRTTLRRTFVELPPFFLIDRLTAGRNRLWYVDVGARAALGAWPVGVAKYLARASLMTRATSLHHLWFIPLGVWVLSHTRDVSKNAASAEERGGPAASGGAAGVPAPGVPAGSWALSVARRSFRGTPDCNIATNAPCVAQLQYCTAWISLSLGAALRSDGRA